MITVENQREVRMRAEILTGQRILEWDLQVP